MHTHTHTNMHMHTHTPMPTPTHPPASLLPDFIACPPPLRRSLPPPPPPVQTHSLHSENGDITTGPLPTYIAPLLRPVEDEERRVMEGYGTGPQKRRLLDIVNDIGLVDELEDFARAALRTQLGIHPGATYPGFVFRSLALYNSYVVKSHGRRPFRLDVRPKKVSVSDSLPAMQAGMANFTRRASDIRTTVWCAAVDGVHPERSAEIVAVAKVTVSTMADPGVLFWYDAVLVQWHTPVRGYVQDPIASHKPSRVVPGFRERPEPRILDETPAERSAAEFEYMLRHGSLSLAGGNVRVPVNAYHDHVPADLVSLGNDVDLVPPRCIVRRADLVPCFGDPHEYGTGPSPPGRPNTPRPPFFRMWPRG